MELPTGYKSIKQFKRILGKSESILITSHTSPDPDALCSSLATYIILKELYPNKKIKINLENPPPNHFNFLKDFDKVEVKPTPIAIKNHKPDLLIITDCNGINRITEETEKTIELMKENKIKLIAIDHHYLDIDYKPDVLINNRKSAAAEEVMITFRDHFNYEITDKNLGEILLAGVISDTGRFLYSNENFREISKSVAELLDLGLNINRLTQKSTAYHISFPQILAELLQNLRTEGFYSYSYISDDFFQNYIIKNSITGDQYKHAKHYFVDNFLYNLKGIKIGFSITPKFKSPKQFSGSIRVGPDANINAKDIAEKLNGGGHKKAAGFKVEANSVLKAVEKVKKEFDKLN